jgi:hypothetical protein
MAYLISASTGKIHITHYGIKSNTIRYSAAEYLFWEHFHVIHSSHPIRDPIGWKYSGAEDCQHTSIRPEQIKINIAAPSLNQIRANATSRPKGMTPGLRPEALQALKDSKIKEVNHGLDK